MQVKPRVNSTHTAIETASVKHSLNPFDELSIEAAVRLRERFPSPQISVADILVLSIGPTKCSDVLRTALAMGADRALHVEVTEKETSDAGGGELEPLGVAKVLKMVVEREGVNLCILGKQSIDDDSGQTGPMLAGLLGWPQATQASAINISGSESGDQQTKVDVIKEVDGGVETVRARLPMVITTDLRLNEPRYASLKNIMAAKKKKLEKKSLADFGMDLKASRRLKTLKVEEPPPRKGGGKVDGVEGMVSRLRELGAI